MIIITAEDVKANVVTNGDFDIKVLQPFIEPVERRFLRPILGDSMLEAISTYPSTALPESEAITELLAISKRALILLAFELGYPNLTIEISSYGISRTESESRKSLFGYQERNLRDSFKYEGYNALEDVISHLEKNIDLSEFEKWTASDVCANMNSRLINSAVEFTKIYAPLKNSRLVFLNMLSSLQFVTDTIIADVVPVAMLDTLQELIKDRELSLPANAAQKKLLEHIQKPLAYFTIADAIDTLGANYNDRGLMFAEAAGTIDTKLEKAIADRLRIVAADADKKGNAYLTILRQYLKSQNLVDNTAQRSTGYDFHKPGAKMVRT